MFVKMLVLDDSKVNVCELVRSLVPNLSWVFVGWQLDPDEPVVLSDLSVLDPDDEIFVRMLANGAVRDGVVLLPAAGQHACSSIFGQDASFEIDDLGNVLFGESLPWDGSLD